MDFKIAGSARGITSMQLDVKLPLGVPAHILSEALDRARTARLHILEQMASSQQLSQSDPAMSLPPSAWTGLSAPRAHTKPHAPRAEVVKFDPERKRHLVGPGGEMLRYIENLYSCTVDLTEEGVAYIYGAKETDVMRARGLVEDLVIMVKEGDTLSAEVLDVKDFGAMVNITRAQEALLHMSELTHDITLLKKPMHELLGIGQCLMVKVS